MIFDRERTMGNDMKSLMQLQYMYILCVLCVVLCICVCKNLKTRTLYCILNSTYDTIGRTISVITRTIAVCMVECQLWEHLNYASQLKKRVTIYTGTLRCMSICFSSTPLLFPFSYFVIGKGFPFSNLTQRQNKSSILTEYQKTISSILPTSFLVFAVETKTQRDRHDTY